MYINSLLCALFLVVQVAISWTEASGQRKPAYNFHTKAEQHTAVKGIINIDDDTPQNDQVEGSGGSRDDTESGGSGLGPDDEDGEGESGSGVNVSTFSRDTGPQGYSNLDAGLDLELDADPGQAQEPVDNVSETVTNREFTKCEKLANAKNINRDLIGAFLPVCKSNGDFKEEQCDTSAGECWCVDRHGTEVKYTRKRNPAKPNCERVYGDNVSLKEFTVTGIHLTPSGGGHVPRSIQDQDGVETSYQQKPRDTVGRRNKNKKNKKNKKKKNKKPSPEPENKPTDPPPVPTAEPEKDAEKKDFEAENEDKGNKDGTDLMTSDKGQSAASTALMASPGILAGIIGGTIVGLLCAILLVLFIVYRMRKKDEGSYALDEPKHSPSMHSYQRAPAREFYA